MTLTNKQPPYRRTDFLDLLIAANQKHPPTSYRLSEQRREENEECIR